MAFGFGDVEVSSGLTKMSVHLAEEVGKGEEKTDGECQRLWESFAATLHSTDFSLPSCLVPVPFLIVSIASYIGTCTLNRFQLSNITITQIRRIVFALQDAGWSRASCLCCVFTELLSFPSEATLSRLPCSWVGRKQ